MLKIVSSYTTLTATFVIKQALSGSCCKNTKNNAVFHQSRQYNRGQAGENLQRGHFVRYGLNSRKIAGFLQLFTPLHGVTSLNFRAKVA